MELFKGNELLNKWFVGILWLKIVFSSLALTVAIIGQINSNPDWWFFIDVVLMLIAIGGAYLFISANKIGFYLVIGPNLISAIICWIMYINFDSSAYGMFAEIVTQQYLKGVWTGIGQIILILLLMLLSRNGKNVYQVLWNSKQ